MKTVKKISIKIIIAVLLTIVIGFISNSLMPLLGNDIAIGQLQNDDAYFVAMQAWYTTQVWLTVIAAVIWGAIGLSIGHDIYKEYKNKVGEEK